MPQQLQCSTGRPRRRLLLLPLALLVLALLGVVSLAASATTATTAVVTPPSLCGAAPGAAARLRRHRRRLPSLPSSSRQQHPPLPLLLHRRGGAKGKGDDAESLMARIEARKGSWGVRVVSTVALLAMTAVITAVGQRKGLELIVIGAQAGAYNEGAQLLDKGLNLRSSLASRWLWFALAVMAGHAWAYGSRLMPSLLPPCFHWFWPRRQFLYFLLYTVLLGGSISVTGPGEMLKRQMAHLAGLHFALFLIVGLGSGYIAILKQFGVRHFLLSCLLVVVNDICAYLVGVPFGRTPLTKLSPKKSWEGFLGAAGLTIAAAPGLVRLLRALLGSIPEDDIGALGGLLPLSDWQALWLAFFASFGAPLGGILASAAKRAVEMKDFGQSIPGHGGVMDRVDCQLFQSAFAFQYLAASAASVAARTAAAAAGGGGAK